jgi:hypothetical protein
MPEAGKQQPTFVTVPTPHLFPRSPLVDDVEDVVINGLPQQTHEHPAVAAGTGRKSLVVCEVSDIDTEGRNIDQLSPITVKVRKATGEGIRQRTQQQAPPLRLAVSGETAEAT